ncbi:MAG TPA: CinA family nicotinamide mononucleotide deamidase-related protein [Flavobacteriales bacterium]|nr:CinA family nicotinamide mononucleotide deamidase-related protein [Flavobacteriales bacterium]HRO38413.1 CinA family nicotinamide mononucleotide deamidase-related protein [Flavobacteriales bacterium]HRQ83760.1 CinA family nicotinamide mononucleotide deamidase-related protein [Flavobacteriales bacterium]
MTGRDDRASKTNAMDTIREVTAECLCIGDELLIGQVLNTNAAWIGQELGLAGIRTVLGRVVGDDQATIVDALRTTRTDIVLLTGGLGPTKDDVTKRALCEFFGTRLVRNPEAEARVVGLFSRLGRDPGRIQPADLAQAMLPESCTVLPNLLGTASGMWFEKDGRVFASLPGVPYEMQAIMHGSVLPRLQGMFRPPAIVHRTIRTTGMGETPLAERLSDWESGLEGEGIRLAYLPSPGQVRLRLSSYAGKDAAFTRNRVDRQVEALYRLIPELIFGEGRTELEEVVGGLLRESGQTLSLAESCTGGFLSHLITSVPGSSAYYIGGVVSYANAVKMAELGIPRDMLELNGVVSGPVAEQMAMGVRTALKSDWAVSTTGIAGPDGGTPDKPVGTVWIAVAGPDGVVSERGVFMGTRDLVISRAATAALNMLRKQLISAPRTKG